MIYIGSDTIVTWSGLQNSITGAYVNDAAITATLQAPTPYTFSLSYEANSDGDYVGTIPAAITSTLTEGTAYLLEITATEVAGTDYRQESHIAQYRGFSA
jgi:hypothetical protein